MGVKWLAHKTTTAAKTSIYDEYNYEEPEEEEPVDDDTEDDEESAEAGDSDAQTGDEEDRSGASTITIVIAACLIILIGGAAVVFGLHKGRKLPQSFYNVFGPRWKPVMTNDEMAAQEDEEKHPSILKNQDLNETAMTEDGVNVNNDLTTVTWTSDEKHPSILK